MRRLPELEQITAFLAVAEELSFRRAAERLQVDQSGLSRRVKDLEARLGYQLLFRTTHAVRLTDAGRTFYSANRRIVETIRSAADEAGRVARGSQGSLRVAYMTFAAMEVLPRAVAEFSRRVPEVSLILSYQPTQLQKVSLARGEIDVGLMLGSFEHADFATLATAREEPVALLARSDPLAGRESLSVEDVAARPLIIGNDQHWDHYRRLIADMLAASGHHASIAFEAPSLFGILGLVREGLGLTIVPKVMAGFCPEGIVARPITDAKDPILTVAAWRQPADKKVEAFVKVLRGMIAPRTKPAAQ